MTGILRRLLEAIDLEEKLVQNNESEVRVSKLALVARIVKKPGALSQQGCMSLCQHCV
jgi:hypothetical protein